MKNYDVCILGAGLAGMHTAIELQEAGFTICVIDPKSIAGGASGTPVGLANPATGRFANRSWEAEESLDLLTARLEQISEYTGKEFYRKSGVLRPALSEKIAARMRENVAKNDWSPADMVEWKSSAEIEAMHPGLTSVEGGVWVPVGLTVAIPDYLRAMHSFLTDHGITFMLGKEYSIQKRSDYWEFWFEDEDLIKADKVVVCAGVYSINVGITTHFPLHAVKGQTASLRSSTALDFEHAVSAQGYFSKISSDEFILGSTYEHKFKHEEPDEQGMDYMFSRFKNVHPALAESAEVLTQWAGIRASTPDRKPVIGALNEQKDAFVFAGLGSKGLLYSAFGARLLKEHILLNTEMPEPVDVNRFST